MNDKGKEILH